MAIKQFKDLELGEWFNRQRGNTLYKWRKKSSRTAECYDAQGNLQRWFYHGKNETVFTYNKG